MYLWLCANPESAMMIGKWEEWEWKITMALSRSKSYKCIKYRLLGRLAIKDEAVYPGRYSKSCHSSVSSSLTRQIAACLHARLLYATWHMQSTQGIARNRACPPDAT